MKLTLTFVTGSVIEKKTKTPLKSRRWFDTVDMKDGVRGTTLVKQWDLALQLCVTVTEPSMRDRTTS